MAETTLQLGFVPKNRGEYQSTPVTRYYKDNVVQYNGSSYIADPVGWSESNLYDVDKIPDRYISWMQNGTDKKIGCASGLSLTRDITIDSIRKDNIPIYQSGYEDCIFLFFSTY